MATAADGSPEPDGAGTRTLRADARRNRQRILDAAAETFAQDGIAVPVDEVARRAGVGVGTLYRHFPTKESLYEAIVVARIEQLRDLCQPDDRDPTEAFFEFLVLMAQEVRNKQDLFEALGDSVVDLKTRCATQMAELEQAIDGLRRRAVEAGGVRPDVSTLQVMGLVVGTCQLPDPTGPAGAGCRMLDVVFDGLRART